MKKTIFVLSALLIFITIAGCSTTVSNDKFDAVYLRVSNESQVSFNSVFVSFPGAETTFENVSPGNRSHYQKLENAYRYGYIKIESGDETYVLQPIDFVGEKPLKYGQYTYKLDIVGSHVTLEFLENE